MKEKDDELRTASIGLTVEAINTLEDGGLKGPKGKKSFREMGRLYTGLLATGMTSNQAAAELAVAGVSAATIAELERKYGKFTTVGMTFVDRVAAAIRAGRSDVVSALNYSFGRVMAGQSPPAEGPLHHIGEWANSVFGYWIDESVRTIRAGKGAIAGALAIEPHLGVGMAAAAGSMAGGGVLRHEHYVHLDLANAPEGITEKGVADVLGATLRSAIANHTLRFSPSGG